MSAFTSVGDQNPNVNWLICLFMWEVARFCLNLQREEAAWPLPFQITFLKKKVNNKI